MATEQIRNKYNTLTPAEARKLNRVLSGTRQPLRTASVLRKPRAPPIVVTNLDNEVEKQLTRADDHPTGHQWSTSLARQNSVRSGSLCTAGDRRHTVNPPQGALASRLSLFSTGSVRSASTNPNSNEQQSYQLSAQISAHESFSNLSYKSSRDAPDCAAYDPTYRFQTMSVDLGRANNQAHANANRAYDTMRGRARYVPQRSNTLNYRFSDDSFASAKSDLSAKSSSVTPTKFNPQTSSVREPARSASRASLSSSTYKILQSPFVNFKRLFRGSQKLPTGQTNVATSINGSHVAPATATTKTHSVHSYQQPDNSLSVADFSLSDSISRLSLNKSQSPPVCPPPPGELKSMSYLESSINYSNYDDFTRARNERLTRPSSVTGSDCPSTISTGMTKSVTPTIQPIVPQVAACTDTFGTSMRTQQPQQTTYDTVANDDGDNSSWQMTSLPVYYERNLTTVFEEKQASSEMPGAYKTQPIYQDNATLAEEIYQRIKPPVRFDDVSRMQDIRQANSEPNDACEQASSVASSSHSPALSSTAESVLEYHRQQPATPYRFSFAQPLTNPDQGLGLPPRVPSIAAQQPVSNNSESQRHDNSSSGNSSNCSSQINGINHCDRRNPTESSTVKGAAETSAPGAIDKYSFSLSESGGYGTISCLNNNDADATLLSETSTLQGESGATYYANKCGELERTVVSLKNKLISKEKELTDLQLSQLNNDYTIERLRKQVSKLERENAQLKGMVVTRTGGGHTDSASAISRIHV